MRKRDSNADSQRDRLIGLGRHSIAKSYYPELRRRLEELEQFRSLLDRINDAILIVDVLSGNIIDVSGGIEECCGCSPEELMGVPIKTLLPVHVARFVNEMLHGESGMVRLETTLQAPGSEAGRPVDLSIQVSYDVDPPRAIIVARDISERKEAEEELKKINIELEQRVMERTQELHKANQAKSEFLSIVSHELRTPLTSIIGFTKIINKRMNRNIVPELEQTNPSMVPALQKISANLEVIISEGDRLTNLINDLLDVVKLEAGRMEYHLGLLDVSDLLQQAADAMSGILESRGIPLEIDVPLNIQTIQGDKNRLLQVVINLLSNAVKYADGKPVVLSASNQDGNVRISIRDHGPGVPKHLANAVFDKFITQAHYGDATQKGTGLGLTISKHIVEAHGGSIALALPEDGGSEFFFTIPAR